MCWCIPANGVDMVCSGSKPKQGWIVTGDAEAVSTGSSEKACTWHAWLSGHMERNPTWTFSKMLLLLNGLAQSWLLRPSNI